MKKFWILFTAVALLIMGILINFYYPVFSAGDYCLNYFSAGRYSIGIFSAGIFSIGVFSIGIFSIGIFSIGIFNVGVFAIGFFMLALKKHFPKLLFEAKKEV
ncbi:MAG: hypothetical protein L3J74_04540 [Bacteroidales bacterium]|nr:hypothetical protein [Bacteroidales bacterium]